MSTVMGMCGSCPFHIFSLLSRLVNSIASRHGVPSLVKDDYVSLSASNCCTLPNRPAWLSLIPRLAIDALRIARFTDRVASTLGHAPSVPSGKLPYASTAPLFSVFNAELGELDRSVGVGDDSDEQTKLRLHFCRIKLCVFMLQSVDEDGSSAGTGKGQRALAATDCYVSSMRLIKAACTAPCAEVARWPRSVAFGYSIACVRFALIPYLSHMHVDVLTLPCAYRSV